MNNIDTRIADARHELKSLNTKKNVTLFLVAALSITALALPMIKALTFAMGMSICGMIVAILGLAVLASYYNDSILRIENQIFLDTYIKLNPASM